MTKMSLSIKRELLAVYKQERSDMRCKIVKDLIEDGKKLTKDVDSEILVLKTAVSELEDKRENILKQAKLTIFERGYKVCALDEMHPKLLKFDAETVRGTRKILEE